MSWPDLALRFVIQVIYDPPGLVLVSLVVVLGVAAGGGVRFLAIGTGLLMVSLVCAILMTLTAWNGPPRPYATPAMLQAVMITWAATFVLGIASAPRAARGAVRG
jgi:hypothetical protein